MEEPLPSLAEWLECDRNRFCPAFTGIEDVIFKKKKSSCCRVFIIAKKIHHNRDRRNPFRPPPPPPPPPSLCSRQDSTCGRFQIINEHYNDARILSFVIFFKLHEIGIQRRLCDAPPLGIVGMKRTITQGWRHKIKNQPNSKQMCPFFFLFFKPYVSLPSPGRQPKRRSDGKKMYF
jgi:hypothetical protein